MNHRSTLSQRQPTSVSDTRQPSSDVPQSQLSPSAEGTREYRRVLVPLDGSALAEIVLTYARELSAKLGLRTTFFRVCNPEEADELATCQAYVQRVAEDVRAQWQERTTSLPANLHQEAPTAEGDVAAGYPAEEILRYAESNGVDLILMATHGRSGIGRWAMGSVADKVLRVSTVPVWLVRASVPDEIVNDKWPRKAMLVPLDGSALAESVLPHVEALAEQRGTDQVDVVLLTVCEFTDVPDEHGNGSPSGWERGMRREIEASKGAACRYLAQVQKRFNDRAIRVRSEVIVGDPAKAIIEYASGYPFTLIAMATHGRSGIGRWAYGSVADKVLRSVTSPLFLVRPA
ncbi:MAG: universal stress protein [Chloroflexota bacterium]|nr:universal stress protein [Chloroflexota bacterium]